MPASGLMTGFRVWPKAPNPKASNPERLTDIPKKTPPAMASGVYVIFNPVLAA